MVLRTVIRVVLIFVGTLFVGILGTGVGIVWPNITLATVLRSVFVIALVLAMTLNFRIRDKKAVDHAGRPDRQVLTAAGLACAANILAWGGQSLFGHLMAPAGVFCATIDFGVWMAVSVVRVRLGDRVRGQATVATTPAAGGKGPGGRAPRGGGPLGVGAGGLGAWMTSTDNRTRGRRVRCQRS